MRALRRPTRSRPLALGRTDTDGNVQPLCRPCHRLKTREDFGARSTPP
ncbi:HNH endonuclease signature motif containing protein [Streptomyces sp. NPDC060048]